jgi:murein DD-endopeptidase MepM/ murein hydrolase activator NlpD
MTKTLLLVVLCTPLAATAELPQSSPVPGGVAVVPLAMDGDATPKVMFNGQRVLTVREKRHWQAVVGLPLALEPGKYALKIRLGATETETSFQVSPKKYETQRLTIADKRHVEPLAEDQSRIKRDNEIINRAFATWSDTLADNLRFDKPAKGPFSSRFGLRRILNGQPRQPHSGLDIAAPEGTPVTAPAAGLVIETGNFFYTGNTVFLDHGQGLVSMYIHLSRIDVEKDARVTRGQGIGLIGKTGRTTGAHLHWAVSLNNARVDPMLFLPPSSQAPPAAPANPVGKATNGG